MFIVNHRSFFFWLTGLLLVAAIASIAFFGLPPGIDFAGGTLMQVSYPAGRPALSDIQKQVATVPLGAVSVRENGPNAVAIRTLSMTPAEHEAVLSALGVSTSTGSGLATTTTAAGPVELAYTSVGPSLGAQFTNKAIWALFVVVLFIVLYIAWAFRKVSRPVPSWGYGVTVVAMLAIDIIVPTGFYAALAHYTSAEVDSLFIVALLALLGYCVNDVIVIFDRVREHLAVNEKTGHKEPFETTIGKSIDETMTRSINTGLTVVLALVALIWFGAPATRDFALVMLVGVAAGTFSSVARSAPLLIPIANWLGKDKKK